MGSISWGASRVATAVALVATVAGPGNSIHRGASPPNKANKGKYITDINTYEVAGTALPANTSTCLILTTTSSGKYFPPHFTEEETEILSDVPRGTEPA